jgi:uncharacterized protein
VIAVDTNILVYAHRKDSAFHTPAREQLRALTETRHSWAIPWPCLHEFLAIVTHPRIYAPPTPVEKAIDQVEAWLESPNVSLIGESDQHWATCSALLRHGQARGPQIHDARVAAICLAHGVRELLTADRDFSRFPSLETRNPLVEQ